MAINLRKFETVSEFSSAYTGDTYVEPWVSYIEETSGIVFNKVYLKRIEIKSLKMVGDVPASGGTVNKDNCTYVVNAVYNDMRRVDVTESAVVTGSLTVEASQVEHRHSAGTLTLTATYEGFETSGSVVVWQEAFIPSVTAITLDNLTWAVDMPASGGTATKDNCTYTVTAHYNIEGRTEDVTSAATVTGSLVVPESEITERHSAGTLTLTAEYSGLTGSADVAVYQEESVSYLKFNILSGGVIAFGAVAWNDDNTATTLTIEYKKNDGEWIELTSTVFDKNISAETREDVVNSFSSKFSVVEGDVIMFRGNNQAYAFLNSEEGYTDNFNAFFSTARFNVEGNIMSLIDKENYDSLSALTAPATFSYLFSGCYRLISAENLLLPAMTLTDGCYSGMFIDYVGEEFFDLDMGLTTAPALPATTLAIGCYAQMFGDCTSLTQAPELPATTLASYCYNGMFIGCTSLTQAPELPATTLASNCYELMFAGCTSLTTAPALPATTLAENCYGGMFNRCTSLNSIKCLATDISASSCTTSWVDGVASTGTFTKNASMSSWTTGVHGIPANWDVVDAQ